jgi:membrane protease subunit HflC
VDTYSRWRISNPLVFFQRVRDERSSHSRLDDIVDGVTRDIIAKYDLIEIVRSSNRQFEQSDESAILDISEEVGKVEAGRDKLTRAILENASKITPEFGVELKDVQIKRVNYVDEVQRKVFDRMIAERQRIASKYRSEGDGKSAEIRGQKERELKRIQSEAYRKAQEIKGKADAEATRIYAQAYNLDPEFYQFMKTLETYKASLDKETWLILSTSSEFLKYLKSTGAR